MAAGGDAAASVAFVVATGGVVSEVDSVNDESRVIKSAPAITTMTPIIIAP
jgi:hypothetical protein